MHFVSDADKCILMNTSSVEVFWLDFDYKNRRDEMEEPRFSKCYHHNVEIGRANEACRHLFPEVCAEMKRARATLVAQAKAGFRNNLRRADQGERAVLAVYSVPYSADCHAPTVAASCISPLAARFGLSRLYGVGRHSCVAANAADRDRPQSYVWAAVRYNAKSRRLHETDEERRGSVKLSDENQKMCIAPPGKRVQVSMG